ncbi:MAG TPA: VWA domain-containing protein [Steroidobacteraceae bacterium]|nr:VWA domain-containing protein [Steroidobacteraceae bacterium]
MRTSVTRATALALAVFFLGTSSSALAVPDDRDRDREIQEVVVTGSFVTQGGAKDVNYLRGEVEQSRIPHPETFTAEGLLSEHSIVMDSGTPCAQVFCLVADSIDANLIAQPEARYLIGLGFATNIQSEGWHRKPLNLVATVDKSGSMNGAPLALVRSSLLEVLDHMREGDRISIVLYGDEAEVYLAPTDVTAQSRGLIRGSIKAIESAGSTAMEEGLRLGYEVARQSSKQFAGVTRVMLFTDERPNVGNTEDFGFMTMAREASHDGIGLTTIGVGVQFDAELATTIGSVRGGNLFFMRDEDDVQQVFRDEFDFMVSELAHDLAVSITPQPGYNISGVYGVPDGLMGWQNERTVKITIPTVFLSSKGGAMFVALAKSHASPDLPARPLAGGAPLASLELQYVPVSSGIVERDRIDAFPPPAKQSDAMKLGHALIDEFTVLRRATTAHYMENDQNLAYQLVHDLATRLSNNRDQDFDKERLLTYSLEERFAFLSGHTGEPRQHRSPIAKLWGTWEVRSVQGRSTLRPSERLEFTPAAGFRYYRKDGSAHVLDSEGDFGASRRQIDLEDLGLVFDYEIRNGNELVLADGEHQNLVFLQRRHEK